MDTKGASSLTSDRVISEMLLGEGSHTATAKYNQSAPYFMPEKTGLPLCECIFVITSQLTNIYGTLRLFKVVCIGIINAYLSLNDAIRVLLCSFIQWLAIRNLDHHIPVYFFVVTVHASFKSIY